MISLLAINTLLAADSHAIGLALLIGLGFGISSAAHCAGMCGAFPIAAIYGAKSWRARLIRATAYNGGRAFTYLMLGGTAAAIGLGAGNAAGLAETGMAVVRWLSIAAAVVIAISGLFLLGVRIPLMRGEHGGVIGEKLATFGRSFMRSKHPAAPLALGVLNGLLPCPLVYGMIVLAFLAAASPAGGLIAAITLVVGFALGTMPMMMGIAIAGGPLLARLKPRIAKIAGVFLLFVAAGITLTRGLDLELMHEFLPPVGAAPHYMEDDDGEHLHVGSDQLKALIPNAEGMDHAVRVDGVWVFMGARPEGMSQAEYDALHQAEVEREQAKQALLKADPEQAKAELRKLDQELATSLIDTEGNPITGKRCYTLTADEVKAMQAASAKDQSFEYRCVCCGTVRGINAAYLFEGLTLVLDEDQRLPIEQDAASEEE